MAVRPEVFISAASRDLKGCRQLVRDALLTLGCVPVAQDNFPPGAGEVRAMLRERIAGCHAVIHLAGECYGFEPQEHSPEEPRRSYTQLEYDIARELKKPLYAFLCSPDFPYDAHEPEPEELRRLQDRHRTAIASGDALYLPIKDSRELSERVRELQTRVEVLSKDLHRAQSWLGRGIAAAVAVLLLVAGLLYGIKRQGEQSQARAEQRATQLEQQLAVLLQQQTRLTSLVAEKLDRSAPAPVGPGKPDPAAVAREETARQLGIDEKKLQEGLATEKTDVRALLARIDEGSASAEAKVAEWQKLKRAALTKLGDAENAAGHYAVEIEPYQQALALVRKQQEPLVWCDMARNLGNSLWRMGRYTEAEPLLREVMAERTRLQGAEHPDTLASISNLALLLYLKGDLVGAESLGRQCLEARERTLGKEHLETLQSVNILASVLQSRGDLAGAELLDRRCVEAGERTLGKEHPDTLRSVNNLANVLQFRGDLAGAEALDRRCLEAQERILGKEHPDTLATANSLAIVLQSKGDLAGAEMLYRRCLEAQERTLGKEHPNVLTSVNNLAILLQSKGDLPGAEALYRRCAESCERTLGKEHPLTVVSTGNLAQTLDAEGNYPAAEVLYLRAEAGMEHILAPAQLERLDLDYYFSLMRIKQGRLAEALPLAEHAAAGAQKTLAADNPLRRTYEKNLLDLRARLAAVQAPAVDASSAPVSQGTSGTPAP